MKEYIFNELGYFSKRECEAIKKELQGKTYMDFDISWSSCAGNCTLIVKTDYEEEEENEVKNFFLSYCLRCICKLNNR